MQTPPRAWSSLKTQGYFLSLLSFKIESTFVLNRWPCLNISSKEAITYSTDNAYREYFGLLLHMLSSPIQESLVSDTSRLTFPYMSLRSRAVSVSLSERCSFNKSLTTGHTCSASTSSSYSSSPARKTVRSPAVRQTTVHWSIRFTPAPFSFFSFGPLAQGAPTLQRRRSHAVRALLPSASQASVPPPKYLASSKTPRALVMMMLCNIPTRRGTKRRRREGVLD